MSKASVRNIFVIMKFVWFAFIVWFFISAVDAGHVDMWKWWFMFVVYAIEKVIDIREFDSL